VKSITHQIDTASEDCAARMMNEEIQEQDEEKIDTINDEKREGKGSGSKNKQKKSKSKSEEVSSLKERSKDGDQAKKSEYELQKERNIARNQALLANIKDLEFQAAMEEIGKGVPVKKENKTEKIKPNLEECRTSARLTAADGKWVFRLLTESDILTASVRSKSTDEEMKSVNETSTENKVRYQDKPMSVSDRLLQDPEVEQTIDKVTEKPKDETPTDNAGGIAGSNGEVVNAAMGTTDKVGSETVTRPVSPTHTDVDGNTAMTEACDSTRRGDKGHAQSSSNAPFLPPIDFSPSSPVSAIDPSAANALPTSSASPALGVSVFDDSPPASAALPAEALSAVSTPSYLPTDKNVPAYLTQAIIAHLRGVSPAAAWQDLVSAFLQFEQASLPSGVSYYFSL